MNKKYIITSLIVLQSLFIGNFSLAQKKITDTQQTINIKETATFNIINNGEVSDIQPYIIAMSNANFDTYRLVDSRRIIKFDTGVEVELFSANELSAKFPEKMSKIILTKKDIEGIEPPTYKLSPTGHIIVVIMTVYSTKDKNAKLIIKEYPKKQLKEIKLD